MEQSLGKSEGLFFCVRKGKFSDLTKKSKILLLVIVTFFLKSVK